ncbi:hypothetical protein MTR67_040178 [Solanum verrucosum]|uniref:Protein yippee-like n=1 Tax=Solanum verrucosum TaxID=315347 RepID=A0AAF0UI59_SOLVR|nr:hypothetical protein MTR67_019805 [Solanum verrucosum]WMV46425.1 hypothetical protein MTR67_039810 [Solanum verrucosum]WMV46793.1 hypothetical protein MTR67_040178 [Solanum verrucosum]
MKLCNDSLEVSSLLGDLKQGVADELKEQVQRLSFKEQHSEVLGWKYEQVVEPSQKYKEGKSVLELCKIADIYCVDCNEVLGWKYEQVVEPSQKYKEGKFVLELCKIVDI